MPTRSSCSSSRRHVRSSADVSSHAGSTIPPRSNGGWPPRRTKRPRPVRSMPSWSMTTWIRPSPRWLVSWSTADRRNDAPRSLLVGVFRPSLEIGVAHMAERRTSLMTPRMESLLERVDSKFTLVTLSAMRAREINDYYNQLGEGLGKIVPPQVTSVSRKPLSISLEEIEAGKIRAIPKPPEEDAEAEAEAALLTDAEEPDKA